MTQLIKTSELPVSKYTQNDKAFTTLVNSEGFLPRLQLYGSSSELVKEDKIGQGQFAIVSGKDTLTILGKEVQCYPISWRFKAVEFGDQIISKYNPDDAEFKRIVDKASGQGLTGAMAGIEFLLYIPDNNVFCTYFMGNASSKREAPNLRAIKDDGQAATIRSKLVKNKKGQSWHAPEVVVCSTPLATPDEAELLEVATKFANPKETEIEPVSPSEKSTRAQ